MTVRTLRPIGFLTVPELGRAIRERGGCIPDNTIRWWIYTGRIETIAQFGKRGQWIFSVDLLERLPDHINDWQQIKDALGYK